MGKGYNFPNVQFKHKKMLCEKLRIKLKFKKGTKYELG